MKGKQKKGLVALAAVLVVAIAAVGAYAYWTNGGSGSGTATAGTTADNVVITADGWAGIKPGDAGVNAKDVNVNLDNSANAFGSYVKHVVIDSTHAGDTDGVLDGIFVTPVSGSCDSTDFTYTAATSPNVGATLPASDATNAFTAVGTLAWADTTSNQDDCKGATIQLFLKIDNS